MKTSTLLAVAVACAVSAPVSAGEDHAAHGQPAVSKDTDTQMSRMQENMKKMQQQMQELQTTTDPKERKKLMQVHMQTMQENMKAMRGMGGPMMKGGGMMMGGKKGGAADGHMMQRHEMIENRMDMMQTMMEQMMQHVQMMGPMPSK